MSADLYVGPLKSKFMTGNEDGKFFPDDTLTLKAYHTIKKAA